MKPYELTGEEIAEKANREYSNSFLGYYAVERLTRKKLVKWLEEACPHVHKVLPNRPKRACDEL